MLIRPPESRLGPLSADERQERLQRSPLKGRYDQMIDRESAFEVLQARAAQSQAAPPGTQGQTQPPGQVPAPQRAPARQREGVGEALAKSLARSIGTQLGGQLGRQIIRGVLGSLFGGRR